MSRIIKICGVKTPEIAIAAAEAGADLIGFVFFAKSPRYITPEAAEEVVTEVKWACEENGYEVPHFAGLFVDAGEKLMAEAAPFLSWFQFHGHEDASRVAELGAEFGVETIRAFSVAGADDFADCDEFADAADMLLFDARAPGGSDRPGGHGDAFDWSLLRHYRGETPFLLAGGLHEGNVEAAVAAARDMQAFRGLDVSSGVELSPGVKDENKVRAFVKAARAAL